MKVKPIEYYVENYTSVRQKGDYFYPVLKIGNQSFDIDYACDHEEETMWMRCMIGKALAVFRKRDLYLPCT